MAISELGRGHDPRCLEWFECLGNWEPEPLSGRKNLVEPRGVEPLTPTMTWNSGRLALVILCWLGGDSANRKCTHCQSFVICPTYANPHRYGLVFEPDSPPPGAFGWSLAMTESPHVVELHIWDIFHAGFGCDAFCFEAWVMSHQNTAKSCRASEHSELENPSANTNPQSALLSCHLQDGRWTAEQCTAESWGVECVVQRIGMIRQPNKCQRMMIMKMQVKDHLIFRIHWFVSSCRKLPCSWLLSSAWRHVVLRVTGMGCVGASKNLHDKRYMK